MESMLKDQKKSILKSTFINILMKASFVLKTPLELLQLEVKYDYDTDKMEYTFYDNTTNQMLLHIHGLEELEKAEA